MKMISNIQQLKARKKMLLKERVKLEEKLRADWTGMAKMLKKSKTIKEPGETSGVLHALLESGLRYGIGLITEKVTGKTLQALDKIL
jgi:hypothetical protein